MLQGPGSPTLTARAEGFATPGGILVQVMDILVLGPLRAVSDQEGEVSLGGPKPRAVLALLASSPGRSMDTDTIVDELWPEAGPGGGRKTVQAYVARLRGSFAAHGAPDVLHAQANGYALDPTVSIDTQRFEVALADAGPLVHERPAEAARLLKEAASLWRGRPFEDAHATRLLELEAARLDELRSAARELLAEAKLALGRHREVIADLRILTAEDPLRERPWALLMLALYRAGRQAEALAIYPDVARRLRDELGVEPTEELSDLQAKILRQDPSLAQPTRSGDRHALPGRGHRWWALSFAAFAVAVVATIGILVGFAPFRPTSTHRLDLRVVTRLEIPAGAARIVGSGRQVWVATADDPAIFAVTPPNGETVRYALPDAPTAVASALGSIWVASEPAGAIWRVATGTGEITAATTGLDLKHAAIAIAPDAIWVIRDDPLPFLRLDPVSLEVEILPFVDGYGGPADPDIAVLGDRLWGSNAYIGRILSIDPSSGDFEFAGDVRVGEHVARSVLADRGAVWFSQPTNGSVTRLDPTTRAVTATASVGRASGSGFGRAVAPYQLAGGPGGLWVSMPDDGAVAMVDDTSATEIGRLAVARPEGIAVTTGGDVWILDARSNELLGIGPAPCSPLPFIGPGADLRGCDLSEKVLIGVDLTEADLRWADLRMTAAQSIDLTGADLFGADIEGASLEGATWDATRCPDGSLSDQHDGRCPAS